MGRSFAVAILACALAAGISLLAGAGGDGASAADATAGVARRSHPDGATAHAVDVDPIDPRAARATVPVVGRPEKASPSRSPRRVEGAEPTEDPFRAPGLREAVFATSESQREQWRHAHLFPFPEDGVADLELLRRLNLRPGQGGLQITQDEALSRAQAVLDEHLPDLVASMGQLTAELEAAKFALYDRRSFRILGDDGVEDPEGPSRTAAIAAATPFGDRTYAYTVYREDFPTLDGVITRLHRKRAEIRARIRSAVKR